MAVTRSSVKSSNREECKKDKCFRSLQHNYPIRIQFDSVPWLVLFVVEDVEFVLLQLEIAWSF